MSRRARRLLVPALAVLAALVAAAGLGLRYASEPRALSAPSVTVVVRKGSSARGVARDLEASGVVAHRWAFLALARLRGRDADLKAGVYRFDSPVSIEAVLERIASGRGELAEVTLVEGSTFGQMLEVLRAHPHLVGTVLDQPASRILERIGAPEAHPEGLFFPDTYRFAPGSEDVELLRAAYRLMQERLASAWAARAPGLPYDTPYEALIMASIVEKETARPAERPLVAAVFVNRLRIGMRLQTDPSVIYGLGESFGGDLRRGHLLADTPYNTYTRRGLPPTPIAMPGLASIEAALHPAGVGFLYFVARGDGSHAFSASLAEHNRAVAQYQRGARQ